MRLSPITDHSTNCTVRIPTRLNDWRLSSTEEFFAYGGYEVDLSVWDAERAFSADTPAFAGQKRSHNDALLSAEIWRAKNVRHTSLCPTKHVMLISCELYSGIGPTRLPRAPSAHPYNVSDVSPYGELIPKSSPSAHGYTIRRHQTV